MKEVANTREVLVSDLSSADNGAIDSMDSSIVRVAQRMDLAKTRLLVCFVYGMNESNPCCKVDFTFLSPNGEVLTVVSFSMIEFLAIGKAQKTRGRHQKCRRRRKVFKN